MDKRSLARKVAKDLLGWRVVDQFEASNGHSTHTVESNGKDWKCSCQAFRIRKQECKHIRYCKLPY